MPSEEGARRRPRRHRRGEGTVTYDRHGRTWNAVLSLGVRDGRRVRVKRTAPDEATAERELARLQRWYGRAGDVAFLMLEAYLEDWLDAVRPTVAPSSHEAYRNHVVTHIAPLLGPILVGALRPADVRRLIADRLAAGRSPQTVVSIVSTLRHALGMAVRDGDLDRNVAAMVDLPRVDREPVEAMTAERAQAILEAVRGDRLEALFALLLGTGMRVGEVVALDWRDVDLDAGSVTVRRGKTRAARRTLPLPAFTTKALREHRSRARRVGPAVPVFLGERTGERLRGDRPRRVLQERLAAAGLPPMRAHDLRHACATLLLAQGVDMRVIADILGHASPAITSRTYAHVTEGTKRRAVESLEGIGTRMAPG